MPTLWPFRPNGSVLERLEWQTDVLEGDDGTEQRRRNREFPRRSFEFDTVLEGAQRQTAENLLYGQQASELYVPVWMDAEPLSAQVNAAAVTIPATTATRDYQADGLVALINGDDPRDYEIGTIDTVGGSSLTLYAGVAATWPAARTLVAPLRTARLPDSMSMARFTGSASYGRHRFTCTDNSDTAAASESTYRSYPVQEAGPNWTADITQDYARRTRRVQSSLGTPVVTDHYAGPVLLQSHRWLCDGRAEIHALRQWLYARRGRQSAFWQPSWALDLTPAAPIGASDTTIDVAHCGYTDHINQALGRRDIRIITTAGTVYYRRITLSAEISATVERLTISSALGASLAVSDIAAISFMRLARLDTDSVEIAWHRWDVAECAVTTRGIRNDL